MQAASSIDIQVVSQRLQRVAAEQRRPLDSLLLILTCTFSPRRCLDPCCAVSSHQPYGAFSLPPARLDLDLLPKSNMAAAASCCSATTLQAQPAAAPPGRRRGVGGYGCSSARRWALRPHAAALRIRRPLPSRSAAVAVAARVSCAYSTGAERITACSWNEHVICSDVPVLVEFWASWCGPCRMVTQLVDEIAQEYDGKIKCYRLDTDDYPQTATSYGIDRIPTVLFFKDGDKVQSITGTLPKAVYVRAIDKFISEQ